MKEASSQNAAIMITQQNFCREIMSALLFVPCLAVWSRITFLWTIACTICAMVTIPKKTDAAIAAPKEG